MNYFRKINSIIYFVSLLIILCGTGRSEAQVTLIQASIDADETKSVQIDLVFAIDAGYYIQSNKPSDKYLIPTVFTLSEIAGMSVSEIKYDPAASALIYEESAQDKSEVYQESLRVRIRGNRTKGNLTLRGHLEFQACSEKSCYYPRQQDVTLSFPSWEIAVASTNTRRD